MQPPAGLSTPWRLKEFAKRMKGPQFLDHGRVMEDLKTACGGSRRPAVHPCNNRLNCSRNKLHGFKTDAGSPLGQNAPQRKIAPIRKSGTRIRGQAPVVVTRAPAKKRSSTCRAMTGIRYFIIQGYVSIRRWIRGTIRR